MSIKGWPALLWSPFFLFFSLKIQAENTPTDLLSTYSLFAWNAHNESFPENNLIISLLKYRVSYGIMGNDNIKTFGYVSLTGDVSYSFNQTVNSCLTTGNAPNESLGWEKSK